MGLCVLLLTVVAAGFVQIIAGSILGKKADAMPVRDVGWQALTPMAVLALLIMVMGIMIPRPVTDLLTSATHLVQQPEASTIVADQAPPSIVFQK